MKNAFPGHFQLAAEEIKHLWETCIFIVDANILLNLYRYSDETRKEFLHVLESLKDRLWIPHQAAQEYFDGRFYS